MELITLYLWDELGVFAGSIQCDPFGPVPERATPTPPPGDAPAGQVWLWHGAWVAGAQPTPLPQPPDVPTPSVVQVPAAVTMRQARLALLGAGLLDDIDAAINALPSPQKEAARIEWEYSAEVQRHNGFVSVLAPLLGLTDAQTDALFVAAKGL